MPDKGKIMSQTYYERQGKLLRLYEESFARKEMNVTEAVAALRMIGFSETIAPMRVKEWAEKNITLKPETERAKKLRPKERASLEKYVLQMLLGKKYYLRLKYKRKELTKAETVAKLIKSGYSRELSEATVNEWEAQNL